MPWRDVTRHATSWHMGRARRLDPLVPAAHHRKLIAELDRLEVGDDRPADGADAAGQRQVDLRIRAFSGVVAAAPAGSPVIAACHTAELAEHFGRRCAGCRRSSRRPWLRARAGRPRGGSIRHHGPAATYFAAGVEGPITGRRADLAVIDDPIKNHAEADSAAHRDHVWEWFRSDLLTRLEPGGRIVLVMTRWHQDDLGGRLLETAPGLDRTCACRRSPTPDDPLGRAPGAPLWPEWEDARGAGAPAGPVGPRAWSALYQQRRVGRGAVQLGRIALWKRRRRSACVRAWDLAATAAGEGRDPDWTVGLKLGRDVAVAMPCWTWYACAAVRRRSPRRS